jgi:magnesium transporter
MNLPDGDPAVDEGRLLGAAIDHATSRVPVAEPWEYAGAVRERLAGTHFESVSSLAVLERGRLAGLISMERLLAAEGEVPLSEIMDVDVPAVSPDTDQEQAALEMIRRNESNLAVVDRDGSFRGLVPARRMLAVLLEEHHRDLARLGGYMAGTRGAREAAEEKVTRRLLHRLPWLVAGLAGAMASALLVGAFEHQLESVVLVAFFLPAVVYMADAVGTQTETVLIRGLSVGIDVKRVMRREAGTGAVIGVLIAVLFFPFAIVGWGDAEVALAVSVALFASCAIATVVAVALPLLFVRFDRDPAYGSGPLATILQDLLSIAVYLGVATAIVT